MKYLRLLFVFLSVVFYGQDKVNVIETADFNGYDMYGNYIEKIQNNFVSSVRTESAVKETEKKIESLFQLHNKKDN